MKIKIEEHDKIVNTNQVILFDQPEYIYISLKEKNEVFLPLIKKGDYVYQEEKIALRKLDHFPLFSTVSGIVERVDGNGIFIKNDLKNRLRHNHFLEYNILKYTKEEITKQLFELGVRSADKTKIDPYQKLSYNGGYKYLIISALRGEPYIDLETFQLKLEQKPLKELIEAFIEIYNFEEVIIAIPKDQKILLEEWKKNIKESKIKLVELEEYYMLSESRELVWKLKKIQYKEYPIEKGIVIFNVSTLLSIYHALKYQRPKIKMLVQFTGNMWKKNCYMDVRIGSCLKEAVRFLEFKRAKEILLLSGSLMKGEPLKLDTTIMNIDNFVYSAWRADQTKYHTKGCIRCGKCIKVCPSNLNPVLIIDTIRKNKDLSRFQITKCIECGLCSYVCPSNISVCEIISKRKEDRL